LQQLRIGPLSERELLLALWPPRWGGAAAAQPSTVNLSAPPTADSPRITEEVAQWIARAHTLEQGRNTWIGCGIFLAVIVIGAIIFTLLHS
jgi:hypothetical protein